MDLKEHGGLIVSRNNQNEDSCVVLQIGVCHSETEAWYY